MNRQGFTVVSFLVSVTVAAIVLLLLERGYIVFQNQAIQKASRIKAEHELDLLVRKVALDVRRRKPYRAQDPVTVRSVQGVVSTGFSIATDTLCSSPCTDLKVLQTNECSGTSGTREVVYSTSCQAVTVSNLTSPRSHAQSLCDPTASRPRLERIEIADTGVPMVVDRTSLFPSNVWGASLCFRICPQTVQIEGGILYATEENRIALAQKSVSIPLNDFDSAVEVLAPKVCP